MAKRNLKIVSGRPHVYGMSAEQCVWSAAGLAPYRLCHNAFDCISCAYDKKMQRKRDQGHVDRKLANTGRGWADIESRKCRHMLTGYVSRKYCSHDFDCASCEYDQLVESEVRSREVADPRVHNVSGFSMPRQGYYYHRGHAWARVEYGGLVRIGLDDFCARLLGPPDSVDIPGLGRAVGQSEAEAAVMRGGKRAGLLTPLQGVVVAVNPHLEANPELAHNSPYGSGWLMMIQPTRLNLDLRNLLFDREAEAWMEAEAGRLNAMLSPEADYRLAATGASAIDDIYGSQQGLQWHELTKAFLFT